MEWQLIETAPKDRLIIVGKLDRTLTGCHFAFDIWAHIHCAYWADGYALPFDSERGEDSTPFLNEDEQPTHWMEIPKLNNLTQDYKEE